MFLPYGDDDASALICTSCELAVPEVVVPAEGGGAAAGGVVELADPGW
jgi:hypothetical protein